MHRELIGTMDSEAKSALLDTLDAHQKSIQVLLELCQSLHKRLELLEAFHQNLVLKPTDAPRKRPSSHD